MPKPTVFDFDNNAKQDSWKETSRQNYVDLVSSLSSSSEASSQGNRGAEEKSHESKDIVATSEDGITQIMFNRPTKENLNLPGMGDYYCSGNDLTNLVDATGEIQEVAIKCVMAMREFVSSFIDFPKLLVAVVNGPAVGIAVTLLGLFDAVYVSDKATFHTTFSQLGQSPEACSSYTFPKIMGSAKATEMLLFGKKLTAREAWAQGLVSEVFPESTFEKEVWTRLKACAKLPPNGMKVSKELIRKNEKQKLHAVNAEESAMIQERLSSEESTNALRNFMSRKARL